MSPAEGAPAPSQQENEVQNHDGFWENRRLQAGGVLALGGTVAVLALGGTFDKGKDSGPLGDDATQVGCDVDDVRELTKTFPEDSFFPKRDIDSADEAEATRVSWFKEMPLSGETDPASMAALVSALAPFKDKETVKSSDYTNFFDKKFGIYTSGDGENDMQRDCDKLEDDTRNLFNFDEDGDWTQGQNIVQLVPVYKDGEVVGSKLAKATNFEDLKGVEFKINGDAKAEGYNGAPEVLVSKNGGVYLKGVQPTPKSAKKPQDHKAKGGAQRRDNGRSNTDNARSIGTTGGGGSGPSTGVGGGGTKGERGGCGGGGCGGAGGGGKGGGGGGGGCRNCGGKGGGGGGGQVPPPVTPPVTPPPETTPPPVTPPPKGPDTGCPPGAPCE